MNHSGSTPTLAVALALALAGAARAAAEAADDAPAPAIGKADPHRASAPDGVAALLARADAAWSRRDEPGQIDVVRSSLEEARTAAPDAYDVLWRMARLYAWLADDPTIADAEKSRLGRLGWDAAERAVSIDPKRAEGWFYAAADMGNYALGLGVVKALGEGIEGKFRDRLSAAERLDPSFDYGAIYNAWGRFYFKLPWPKYDPKKSERALLKALQVNPSNVRGRVYLAELYLREDHRKEARKLLQDAVAHQPGAYDAPEERRYQQRARDLLTLNR